MGRHKSKRASMAREPARQGEQPSQPPRQPEPTPLAVRDPAASDAVANRPQPAAAPVETACPSPEHTLSSPDAQPQAEASTAPVEAPQPVPLDAWRLDGVAVAGLAHWRQGLPCQDAVAQRRRPRPILALSDGAGSAAVSHLGAARLVEGLCRFVMSLEDVIAAWLDAPDTPDEATARIWSQRLLAHAAGLLEDLAERERRPVKDFRATALLVILGQHRIFCWQVGDGAIVAQRGERLEIVSSGVKGEFANQTVFVDAARTEDVRHAVLAAADVTALALMSDGGAERLVASHGGQVAALLGQWFDDLADGRLRPDRLAVAYHEPRMWERTSLDDRGIVMAAR